jgi:hypothetical protein
LPHVINTILYPDYAQVISMLETNPLSAGEFAGRTVESKLPYFRDQVRLPRSLSSAAIHPFVSFDAALEEVVQVNFQRTRDEVREIVKRYSDVYHG